MCYCTVIRLLHNLFFLCVEGHLVGVGFFRVLSLKTTVAPQKVVTVV